MSLRMMNAVSKLSNESFDSHCPLCGRSFARVASSEEHIFPGWLQRRHNLLTQRLTIPNFIGKQYKSVRIRICFKCNNVRFGQLETRFSNLARGNDTFAAFESVSDADLAIWLGKIFWLLCCKSHSVLDHRTRNDEQQDHILPDDMFSGVRYLGMIERAYAMKKRMFSCYADDPADPHFYEAPYSLYRFRIDTRDTRFKEFDFTDNVVVLSAAIRTGTLGLICLFDGGLHRHFRAHRFAFLEGHALHPNQFKEVVGRMFYDRTVLDDDALRVTYFWNKPLKAVIAAGHTSRFYNPFLEMHHDRARYADMLGHMTHLPPEQLWPYPDRGAFTTLQDMDGHFLRYAVTEEEIEAARRDPRQIILESSAPSRQRRERDE